MEIQSSSKEAMPGMCEICHEKKHLYSCPRCNIQYCSVNCYKNRSHVQCSEGFYEQCVRDEMATMGGNSEAAKKMADILKKMREEENDTEEDDDDPEGDEIIDSDDDDSIGRRFADVNLEDGEEIWNSLTDDERKQFVALLDAGGILHVVPTWAPWWTSQGQELPQMAQNISPLSQLTSVPPSPNLPAIVMNTLSSYLVTCRLLKGEVHGLCVEAATAIWDLSRTLHGGADIAKACHSFAATSRLLEEDIARREDWFVSSGFRYDKALLDQDLDDIRQHGSTYVLLALSDILAIMQEALEVLSTSKNLQRFTGVPPGKQVFKLVQKKLTFYIAWAKEADPKVWDSGNLVQEIVDDHE